MRAGEASLEAGQVAKAIPAAPNPLQGMTPADVVNHVQALGLQTATDEALFWSGLGAGKTGVTGSQAYAAQAGGRTLEMTPGGKWLNDMNDLLYSRTSPFTPPEVNQIWRTVSRLFAEQASGQVRVLQGQVSPTSVFRTIESPALQANPRVLGIEHIQLKPRYTFGGH